ncbi:MAG: hypothetical protein U1E22_08030, partial [Coriobacteriia bacterium]|nr:hypothetical protein [Coriobacteriia bacterium]
MEAHKTRFDAWGQPVHTQVVKKQEEWLFYEDPSGYRGIATREVVRVGTQAAQFSGTGGGGGPVTNYNLIYPETAVKFLTMRAQVDPGLGVVTQFEEPDGTKTQALYDSLGRLSSVWGAHAPRSACVTPQLPSVSLEYDLASSSRRYNVLRTTVYEDRCDPNQAKRSVAFVDGLGRTLLTCTQGPDASGARRTICSGAHVVSARGLTVAAYTPTYVNYDLDAPLSSLRLPAFPQVNCPTDPATPITDAHVCVSRQAYDAFGRKTVTTAPDGTRSELRYFGPRRVQSFNDQDLGSGPHANTPREVETDGHGQLVQVVESYKGGEDN